jgi:hypothetical protein
VSASGPELQPAVDALLDALGVRVKSGSIVIHLDDRGDVKLVETKQVHRPPLDKRPG